jgi:putative hemolysin
VPVAERRDMLGVGAFPGEEEDEFETLGGYMMSALGRVPRSADCVEWDDLCFEVVDMDGNRVDTVLVVQADSGMLTIGK